MSPNCKFPKLTGRKAQVWPPFRLPCPPGPTPNLNHRGHLETPGPSLPKNQSQGLCLGAQGHPRARSYHFIHPRSPRMACACEIRLERDPSAHIRVPSADALVCRSQSPVRDHSTRASSSSVQTPTDPPKSHKIEATFTLKTFKLFCAS